MMATITFTNFPSAQTTIMDAFEVYGRQNFLRWSKQLFRQRREKEKKWELNEKTATKLIPNNHEPLNCCELLSRILHPDENTISSSTSPKLRAFPPWQPSPSNSNLTSQPSRSPF